MAVSPKDIELTAEELAKASELEQQIDEELKTRYVKGHSWVDVTLPPLKGLSLRIANELARRYQEAGWKRIERRESDQWRFHCV